jgi:hypothetical protein
MVASCHPHACRNMRPTRAVLPIDEVQVRGVVQEGLGGPGMPRHRSHHQRSVAIAVAFADQACAVTSPAMLTQRGRMLTLPNSLFGARGWPSAMASPEPALG